MSITSQFDKHVECMAERLSTLGLGLANLSRGIEVGRIRWAHENESIYLRRERGFSF